MDHGIEVRALRIKRRRGDRDPTSVRYSKKMVPSEPVVSRLIATRELAGGLSGVLCTAESSALPPEVVVVDNGSSDASSERR